MDVDILYVNGQGHLLTGTPWYHEEEDTDQYRYSLKAHVF